MPEMWELPPATPEPGDDSRELLVVRHSILNTDFRVRVMRAKRTETAHAADHPTARWFTRQEALALPLTGLARKILMRCRNIY